ncbi:hypothetical protein B0T13DRAFT_38883 [Neurospora crassa]|nr:hypothetical protein B0T13DRAFT_38883 [Neurospora crassa]
MEERRKNELMEIKWGKRLGQANAHSFVTLGAAANFCDCRQRTNCFCSALSAMLLLLTVCFCRSGPPDMPVRWEMHWPASFCLFSISLHFCHRLLSRISSLLFCFLFYCLDVLFLSLFLLCFFFPFFFFLFFLFLFQHFACVLW